jgi:glycosyltransferase involved in cell wall biosynthesis
MKEICHLTSVHPPFDIRIFHKECKTLMQAGYRVVLIVPHDQPEEVDGIRIQAIPKPKSRLQRITRTQWKLAKQALKQNAEICHFHDLELIPSGLFLKLCGKRVIYDVHEDYSQSLLTKEWIPRWLRRMLAKVLGYGELLGANFFDAVMTATPRIATRFPASKTITVQNFPLLVQSSGNSNTPYQQRENIIAYVGMVSALRGAREMVEAMALLPARLGARLKIAGNFSPAGLEEEARRFKAWDRVDFLGWLSHEEAIAVLRRARIGLVVLHPVPNHTDAQPNKLFEYMSAGIPVIASDFPLWRQVVEGNRCGIVVDPLNPRAISEAIQWLLDHPTEAEEMGKRGAKAIRESYNWNREAQKLLTFYEGIFGER